MSGTLSSAGYQVGTWLKSGQRPADLRLITLGALADRRRFNWLLEKNRARAAKQGVGVSQSGCGIIMSTHTGTRSVSKANRILIVY